VLEAMAMARPVLLTPEAATGINARDGEDWMISPADPQAMVARFEALTATPAAARAVGQAARRFVVENHAWDAMLEPLAGLIGLDGKNAESRNVA